MSDAQDPQIRFVLDVGWVLGNLGVGAFHKLGVDEAFLSEDLAQGAPKAVRI